ncbi:AIG2-like [Macleaya cordata]|uniref:Gamma-glutamylcyclotransferase family protein n=1 Tax=Macleaya cordata TaxID=56857 RepID=A0A200PXI4_MACCD|nr:AIG2-like [Macleaya cordata]
MGAEKTNLKENQTLVFTYGTLKHGFPNHGLIQDMIRTGDAVYLGVYRTKKKYPLVCGPFRVPFLLNFPGSGDRVWGELYAVSRLGLERMDELEGTSHGHYERLPLEICAEGGSGGSMKEVEAVAYYGHRSYAEELWKRNGEKSFCKYSDEEAKGYVKRQDRPKNFSFIEQIRLFISSSPGSN